MNSQQRTQLYMMYNHLEQSGFSFLSRCFPKPNVLRYDSCRSDPCTTREFMMQLGTFTANATSQLNILGHDSNTLGMDCTQVGVFKESDEVSLSCFLESENSSGPKANISYDRFLTGTGHLLETEIVFKVLGNFTDETLERSFEGTKFA